MASKQGQVTLRGRFSPGSLVRLVEVEHAGVLRAGDAPVIAEKRVDEDGMVRFRKDVRVDGRYFIVGIVDGFPLEVRVRGNAVSEDNAVLSQPPVRPDRVRLADGSWADEAPEREETPRGEAAPAPSQQQVPEGTVQRSATPRGSAHPVDTDEAAPYGRQEDVDGDVVQRSSTETGRAAPIDDGPGRQEDVPDGVLQRSDTPTGVATPLPKGDAVRAQQEKESSRAKESRGEPVRVAAEPLEVAKTSRK